MSTKKKESAATGESGADRGDSAGTGPDDLEPAAEAQDVSLSERLQQAEAKAQENYDRLLRITAEFENYKKRSEREMAEFRKFANESLAREILPVLDNLERALTAESEQNGSVKGLREGVEMTLKGLLDSLERFGVVPIEAQGQPFDPHFHQAVSHEETEKHPENTVSRELQRGYLLNDRLLRPSMVLVAKAPAKGQTGENSHDEGGTRIKVRV